MCCIFEYSLQIMASLRDVEETVNLLKRETTDFIMPCHCGTDLNLVDYKLLSVLQQWVYSQKNSIWGPDVTVYHWGMGGPGPVCDGQQFQTVTLTSSLYSGCTVEYFLQKTLCCMSNRFCLNNDLRKILQFSLEKATIIVILASLHHH